MTYTFPESLRPLRNHLRGLGCDVKAFATARQAAFMAQQLIGSRIKFPPQGSDMTSTLFLIQRQLSGSKPQVTAGKPQAGTTRDLFSNRTTTAYGSKQARSGKARKSRKTKPQAEYLTAFDPDLVMTGYHIFADGACVLT